MLPPSVAPRLHASRSMPRRMLQLAVGIPLYGIGIALIVRGELGAAPWDVLSQGIVNHIGLTFGMVTVITSAVVLLLWIPIRQKPGLGTVLNALLVGPFADLGLALIPSGLDLWLRIVLFIVGLLVLAAATGLYIGAHFGPGPRDGLMTGLHARTGWAIWKVRTGLEVTVVTLGWLLGGNVGLGTAAFAVFVGPLCQWMIRVFAVPIQTTRTDAATVPLTTPHDAILTAEPSQATQSGTSSGSTVSQ